MRLFRIRIFQPVILEYRRGLYAGLWKRYGDRIEVWAAESLGVDKSVPLEGISTDYGHNFVRIGPFIWQRGLTLKGLARGDVLVVCGELRQLSSLWYAVCARFRGIRVIWWGHHWSSTSRMWKVLIRLSIARLLSNAFLCYTRTGVRFLRQHGFSKRLVFSTGNTIDQNPIKIAMQKWSAENLHGFQVEKCIADKNVLLISGVLRPKMNLPMLISALADNRIRERGVKLVVIGDGPEKQVAVEVAKDLGVANNIIWAGATRDQNELAPWFLSAKIYVYPGAIGLSILHAFSYGLPVITHGNIEHQMPEFEAMEDGKTGLVFQEESQEDMIAKICALLDSPDMCNAMRQNALKKAYEQYSMDNMINNYSEAIEAVARI